MTTALVTGASGLVGGEVTRQLSAEGVRLRLLTRPTTRPDRLPRVAFDLVDCPSLDRACLRRAVAGVDIVFHLAGRIDSGAAFRTDDPGDAYVRDNVTLTERLLQACLDEGTSRFVFLSSSSVYAPDAVSPVDEDAPTDPLSAYGRSKLAAERALWRWRERGVGATVLRAPIIYGPGDRHFRPIVDKVMRLPAIPLPDGGRHLHDLVHVSDVAALAIRAARSDRAEGRTYNATSGKPLSQREIVQLAKRELGYGPRIIPLPSSVLGATFRPTRALLERAVPELKPVLTPSLVAYLSRDFYLSSARAARELGYTPARHFGQTL